MILRAIYNAVIVKPVELEEATYGNIIVPDLGTDKNKTATVVDVGPGNFTLSGTLIPTQVKKGETVIVPSMGFTKFEFEGEEYWIGPENQLLGVIEKND